MIVCADDYGLREDLDQAILKLSGLGKLSAVSCMVALHRCDGGLLEKLFSYQEQLDIGLHLCLTDEGLPVALPKDQAKLPEFKHLFLSSILRRNNVQKLSRLIAFQYALFTEKCGRHPDHIDGHLHVHQLPLIRSALADFVSRLPLNHRPYIRNTWMPSQLIRRQKLPGMKARLIGAFGLRMQSLLQAKGLRTNQGFAGIYDFKQWRSYSDYLPRFTNCLTAPNGILVVHPGFIEDWRRREFECLRDFAGLEKRLNRFQDPS